MGNRDKILELIGKNGQQSIKQLAETLDISLSMTHRHVRKLLDEKQITRIGRPPRVFYILASHTKEVSISMGSLNIDEKTKSIIDQNFLYISAMGERINGWNGFVVWSEKRSFDVAQKCEEYMQIYEKYEALKKGGVISGKQKMVDTFAGKLCLHDVYYADFYAWEVFGKTKLGQLLLYAKQSQNRKIMKEIVMQIAPVISAVIKNHNIDAVGFIPPTVARRVQFMKIMEEILALSLPTVELVKVETDIVTPQKTLNKLSDRIENADHTIVVAEKKSYTNVLLIDDAVGSGATLNQVACKLLRTDTAKKIYGFAITGSVKGFDVISEV